MEADHAWVAKADELFVDLVARAYTIKIRDGEMSVWRNATLIAVTPMNDSSAEAEFRAAVRVSEIVSAIEAEETNRLTRAATDLFVVRG